MTDVKAVIFDLDETLVHERGTAEQVVHETCLLARNGREVDATALQTSVFEEARRLWYAHPIHPFCNRIGVSSWEGLWGRFEGDGPDLAALRAWAPEYRLRTWTDALAVHGIDDTKLAQAMADHFPRERRKHHIVFEDAAPVLEFLRGRVRLGILTNGASDLQREKLDGARLAGDFEAFVAGGDVGNRKPQPDGFNRVLELLGASPAESAMVGDNLKSDIQGACAMGIHAVWLNRKGVTNDSDVTPDAEISGLDELAAALGF
ncbi:MAG: HAD family hydrolase [bacterium]|nr:HAD family hydrolase [bacterium]